MSKKAKVILIVALIAAVIIIAYVYMSGSSTTASTPANAASTSPSGYSQADINNLNQIKAWVSTMAPNSTQQNFWLGVIAANPSSSTLSQWVDCLNSFSKGLNQTQQAFWNQLSQGH